MKILKRIYLVAATAILACALASCGDGALNDAVKNAFIQGDTTQATYDKICKLITSSPERYSDFVDEAGNIRTDELAKYINEVGSALRPPMTWNTTAYGLKQLSLTIYFERSGSMTPYDTPGGGGQLKKAVNDLINFFPAKDGVKINIVNDNIYPYTGNVDSFLQDRNIYESTRGTGNATYTDFKLIFEKILSAQRPGNVSVLVTDMIYSPTNTTDVSVEKILNEENSVATALFKSFKGKAIIVHRLTGDYNGPYYPYNGAPFDYHGKRPFFLIVVADAATIDRMSADPAYAKFLHPDGVTHSYRFNQAANELNYCVVPDWKDNVGRFRVSRDDSHTLTHCEGDRETGKMCFTVAADLKPLNKDNDFLTSTANYTIKSQSNFTFAVRPLTEADVNNNNRSYLDGKSHLFTVTGKMETSVDQLTITLANDFPAWIAQVSTTSDTAPSAPDFAGTTFGLERFLRGIYDAFSAGNDTYGSIALKLEK